MRQTLKVHLLLAFCLIGVAARFAQAQSDDTPVRLHTEEVLLQVSVQSNLGKLPASLDRADLIVTEDDQRRQITSILHTPANLLLILDTSGDQTTRKNINLHRELAWRLIESLDEEDKVAIITYADKVELVSPWTNDRAALKQALDWKFRPGPSARLYDCLTYAADDLLPKVSGRRSVVLLTDGADTSLQSPFEKALKAMHQARATVYVVSQAAMLVHELKPQVLKRPPIWQRIDVVVRKRYELLQQYVRELEAGQAPLRTLAEETGGKIWDFEHRIQCAKILSPFAASFARPSQPKGAIDCEMIKDQLLEEIGSEYVIAYLSERRSADTNFHPVKVYPTRTDLTVRVRRGIYASVRKE
ncbi:MAG TPA: VWA domain-containing protein [Blastocatellia bacterium]|nr:VWA domain-containing protein [Blastocatellia bacterium]